MIKVNIKSSDVEVKSGNALKTGKPYSIREQTAYALIGEEIRKITVSLSDHQAAYAVGLYELLDSSFTTDAFGRLVVGRLHLKVLTASVSKVA